MVISRNGRYVAFREDSSLTVFDRTTETSARRRCPLGAFLGGISDDGRIVSFTTQNRIVPEDTNPDWDVYVLDRTSNTITLISVAAGGQSLYASLSANGRYMAFHSAATTLVPGDRNGVNDVFVHDRRTRRTLRVSVTSAGREANGKSGVPSLAAGGRNVVFYSEASNLVPGDTNGEPDIFLASVDFGHPPVLSWAGTPGYQLDGVRPNQGAAGSRFVFKVKLVDADGNDPQAVRLHLFRNGKASGTVSMVAESGTPAAGCIYRAARLLGDGNWSYAFSATDPSGDAGGQPTRPRIGPIVPGPPYLAWSGASGFESDGVRPDAGTADTTRFAFRAKYTAHDGDLPTSIQLLLSRDGGAFVGTDLSPISGTDASDGIIYGTQTRLPAGQYTYRFAAADPHGPATGAPTKAAAGPAVSAGSSLALIALSATPTRAGTASVQFVLSAPARVTAHAISPAGRVVAVLADAEPRCAGPGALLWSGRGANGLPLPDGRYLVAVSATSETGAMCRALAPICLTH